jgi:hypothetical protein
MDFRNYLGDEATASRLTYVFETLMHLADDLGQTDAEIKAKLNVLFSAYPGEWSIYFLLSATAAILSALEADTTIPWLNATVRDISVRDRLIHAVGVYNARRAGTYAPIEPKPAPPPPQLP